VVNVFSSRASKPSDLKRAAALGHDIVGSRTDDVIREVSHRSPLTLAVWRANGVLLGRGGRSRNCSIIRFASARRPEESQATRSTGAHDVAVIVSPQRRGLGDRGCRQAH
jgi:hypothetical protein